MARPSTIEKSGRPTLDVHGQQTSLKRKILRLYRDLNDEGKGILLDCLREQVALVEQGRADECPRPLRERLAPFVAGGEDV